MRMRIRVDEVNMERYMVEPGRRTHTCPVERDLDEDVVEIMMRYGWRGWMEGSTSPGENGGIVSVA